MVFNSKTRRRAAPIAALAAALALAAPAAAEERFIVPRPAGWKMVFSTSQPKLTMMEFVPAAESVDDWTQMVTSQTFVGARNVSVERYLERIAVEAKKVCDDVAVTPIRSATVNGQPAALMTQFCTRYAKTGKGEITLYKVIQGRDALYIAYRSWRGAPFQSGTQPVPRADLDAWVDYLNRVTVCDTADSARACPN